MEPTVQLLDYQPQFQPDFERLTKNWLQEYFAVTPRDAYELTHPEETLLAPGGAILVAQVATLVVGVVALRVVEPGVLELSKLGVDKTSRRLGVGRLLCQAALVRARQLRAHTVVLYTSPRLPAALALYQQMGFEQVPLGQVGFTRAEIKMQLTL